METEAQIQYILNRTGSDLVFTFGTIKGFPGQDVYAVQGYDSPYDIERQVFRFQISAKDFFENVIVKGDTFDYVVGSQTYTFEVSSWLNDLHGWVELRVSFVRRV